MSQQSGKGSRPTLNEFDGLTTDKFAFGFSDNLRLQLYYQMLHASDVMMIQLII